MLVAGVNARCAAVRTTDQAVNVEDPWFPPIGRSTGSVPEAHISLATQRPCVPYAIEILAVMAEEGVRKLAFCANL